MREAPRQDEKPARLPAVWPHAFVLIGEMLFFLTAFDHFGRLRRRYSFENGPTTHAHMYAAAYALTLVIGILSAYQLIQTFRRRAEVLRLNARRCQLMVALGVIAVGARIWIEDFGLTFMLWGLFCLWAYKSLDFVKSPFDRE
jgi:ABC-type glycerol-3-phosphate transport system permease component